MCGIVGILQLDSGSVEQDTIRKMISVLRHRGPDSVGFHVEPQVGLGHARLSIIDVAGGRQPMSTADAAMWITFNGEIFNYIELREELVRKGHTFATRSDTEVILHLYQEEGDECVRRLNGQWAFAIWDAKRRKLFLSRDRFGVRPLFYTQTGGKFIFASEIKAIFACTEVPRELDLRGLAQIFTFWVTVPPSTAFKNVLQLPPGNSLVVQDGNVRTSRHWTLPFAPADGLSRNSIQQNADELLNLLTDAARIRLRSDVPVGTYLSGGIDSTLTTALVKQLAGDRLETFSVGFEDSEFDETPFQQEASSFLQTHHHEVRCSSEDIGRVFPDIIWHTEQPILRTAPAPLYLLSGLVRENGFKVVITGEGSDEILGGYDIFKEDKIRRFWAVQPQSQWRPLLLKRLYPYLSNVRNQPQAYLKNFFRICEDSLSSPFFSHLPRWELTSKIKTFFSDEVQAELQNISVYDDLQKELPDCYSSWPSFSRAQFLETAFLLPGYILSSQGDRMAMAHSVEARYPFLDYRVAEFAANLHPSLKMRVLNEKYLLKQVARNKVPASIIRRSKQPYRAPDGESFLSTKAHTYVDALMSPERIDRYGIFRPDCVNALMTKFKKGRAIGMKDNMALVGVLSTQLLIHQFVETH
jgi:asparagine synthase (glutamine-hydrolysing)